MSLCKLIRFLFILLFILNNGSYTYGQIDYTSLQNSFTSYASYRPQEKIFVHNDKDFYLAGELLWFKVYNVDAALNKPGVFSRIAYVELMDAANKPVLQGKVRLDAGSGSGSFYLPVSINSGNYKLRAYTSWMKNFSASYFFEKRVMVVNPLKPLNLPATDDSGIDINFFPEGGNLVRSIESKIGFKVNDKHGMGRNGRGIIVNERNDTVVHFETEKFGMGHFLFQPGVGQEYKAIVTLDGGRSITKDIPDIYESGYVMSVQNAGSDKLIVKVKTNLPDATGIYLLVHTRNQLKVSVPVDITLGLAEYSINKNDLGEGISHFTVFNEMKQPVCERLYFKMPSKRMGVQEAKNKTQYSLREKVIMDVTTRDDKNEPIAADLSIAVYRVDSLQLLQENQDDIFSNLWLTSDLKGVIQSPSYYFTSDRSEGRTMENLLLTQGWRRFSWNDILKNEKPNFRYLPEFTGHQVTGKVTDKSTGLPSAGIQTYLSIPGHIPMFYESRSNDGGIIFFDVKEAFIPNDIIIQTHSQDAARYNITLTSPFAEEYSSISYRELKLPEYSWSSLARQNVSMQVQNAFVGDKWQRYHVPAVDSIPFFGTPSKQYFLDDYTRFPTMEEVLREYVAEVGVRRRSGEYRLAVLKELEKGYFENDPLVLLDGVPVFSGDQIISFDPFKIRKLDVVTSKYHYGNLTFDGIININTYTGSMEGLKLHPGAVIFNYEGLQALREFYSPVYETAQQSSNRIPDFRNVLYWAPSVRSDILGKAHVEFYTSDLPGKYIVVIQGINEKGIAGSGNFTFDVKAK